MMVELITKVKLASTANVAHWKRQSEARSASKHAMPATDSAQSANTIIAIGASAGGTEAIKAVITEFPASTPGVVIVQHMPPHFTRLFADRLDQCCQMRVKEAENGDAITPGLILIAPGGLQMEVIKAGGSYQVTCKTGALCSGHAPSVDVMMRSVAKNVGQNAIGVMLTGMGHDGAEGLKAMRDAGSRTMAQDEATCVVFGMPKAAWEMGGAERLVPLQDIAEEVMGLLVTMRVQPARQPTLAPPHDAERQSESRGNAGELSTTMKKIMLNIGGYVATKEPGTAISTMALGSCVAIVFYDPASRILAMAHVALPDSMISPHEANSDPGRFADTAIAAMLLAMRRQGYSGNCRDLVVKLIGGSQLSGLPEGFVIGERNVSAIKKLLLEREMPVSAEDVGGEISRSVTVDTETGMVHITSPRREKRVI